MLSFLLAFRAAGIGAHVFFFGQQPGQRSPSRIDRVGLGCSLGIAQLAGFGVEPRAIWAAHRLKRQCKHYRVSERGFKIHVITVNPILFGLRRSIREKLLKFDSERRGELIQTPTALCVHGGVHCNRGQNTLVHRLKSHVEIDVFSGRHRGKGLTKRFGSAETALALTHFTGPVMDIPNVLFVYAHAGHRNSVADAPENVPTWQLPRIDCITSTRFTGSIRPRHDHDI